MGRVKTEKAPAPPVNTGPTKRGGLELNTAKEAKKPKFAKKWAELHGGAEPRMEFFKSEKAQGKGGKAETSLSLRDEPDLPVLLQPTGLFSFETAGYAESSRDFTRAFAGCKDGKGDILLMGVEALGGESGPAPVVCTQQTGGNVNDDVVALATAEFRRSTVATALAAAGIYCSPKRLAELSARLIGNLTVGAAMDALLQNECVPQVSLLYTHCSCRTAGF